MRCPCCLVFLVTLLGCASGMNHTQDSLIGQDSIEITTRYGVPSSYRCHADLLQLNYGDEVSRCRLSILVDSTYRVVSWASGGLNCPEP